MSWNHWSKKKTSETRETNTKHWILGKSYMESKWKAMQKFKEMLPKVFWNIDIETLT